jgi:hypothetical protein
MIYLLKHCISIVTIDNRYNTTQAKEMVMEWGWFMALCLPHCQEVIWKNSFSTQIGKGWKRYWVNPLRYPWLSMDWFKGRITVNHGFSDQIWGVPVYKCSLTPIHWYCQWSFQESLYWRYIPWWEDGSKSWRDDEWHRLPLTLTIQNDVDIVYIYIYPQLIIYIYKVAQQIM